MLLFPVLARLGAADRGEYRQAAGLTALSGGATQQSRQPMSKTGGFASCPQRCAGCQPEPSSGLSDWRRKRVKSVQFDHESIRPRTFAFSTFLVPPRTRIHADQERWAVLAVRPS